MEITLKDKFGVSFWRNMIMPTIATLGGKSFPKGKVQEFSYGNLKDEKLDFIPPGVVLENRLAIVHIHGGAWVAGSKGRFYTKPLMKFSDAGYPLFSLNYPLAPERPHPYMLQSLLKALVWIKKKYPQYQRIHLIGDSAGGNLAMMLGIYLSNPDLLKIFDTVDMNDLPQVKTVVDIFGVNDRETWVEDGFPSAKLFNRMYLENTSSPQIPAMPMEIEHFENLPHTFIVGAGNDKLLRSSEIWNERISKQFKEVKYKVYEGSDHGFFNFGKGAEELNNDILAFFEKHN